MLLSARRVQVLSISVEEIAQTGSSIIYHMARGFARPRQPNGLAAHPTIRLYSKRYAASSFAAKQSRPTESLSPAAILLQQALLSETADPIATLKDHLHSGTADIQTARVCLKVYYDRLQKVPRLDRRALVEKDSIGRLTLQWL
ncbi:hypothetical protein LTR22_018839 [Elasticomyces elasticus]|nr:hypothetical protein LTR22_018839 [Elasticomyces elasticus]